MEFENMGPRRSIAKYALMLHAHVVYLEGRCFMAIEKHTAKSGTCLAHV